MHQRLLLEHLTIIEYLILMNLRLLPEYLLLHDCLMHLLPNVVLRNLLLLLKLVQVLMMSEVTTVEAVRAHGDARYLRARTIIASTGVSLYSMLEGLRYFYWR